MAPRTRSGALTAGIILIVIGLIFLFDDWAPWSAWRIIVRVLAADPDRGRAQEDLRLLHVAGNTSRSRFPGRRSRPMPARHRRPSLLGGLLWTTVGVLFLLRNFGIGPDFWSMAQRYWPILLILFGLGKVIDYYRQSEGVSLRVGEVVSVLILVVIGSAITRMYDSGFTRIFREMPIHITGNRGAAGPVVRQLAHVQPGGHLPGRGADHDPHRQFLWARHGRARQRTRGEGAAAQDRLPGRGNPGETDRRRDPARGRPRGADGTGGSDPAASGSRTVAHEGIRRHHQPGEPQLQGLPLQHRPRGVRPENGAGADPQLLRGGPGCRPQKGSWTPARPTIR